MRISTCEYMAYFSYVTRVQYFSYVTRVTYFSYVTLTSACSCCSLSTLLLRVISLSIYYAHCLYTTLTREIFFLPLYHKEYRPAANENDFFLFYVQANKNVLPLKMVFQIQIILQFLLLPLQSMLRNFINQTIVDS